MTADVFLQATPRRSRKLSDEHRRVLVDGSGILPGIVKARGYYTLQSVNVKMLVGEKVLNESALHAESWLGIPIYRPDGEHHGDVIRLFGSTARMKYIWPTGFRQAVDVHPDYLKHLEDEEYAIALTEGIKKSDAILSQNLREGLKIVPLAVNGCWGWKATTKAGAAVCTDFYDVPTSKRTLYVISDSDYRTNDNVRQGWTAAAHYFSGRAADNAKALLVVVPPDGPDKQGADDYLVHGGSLKSLLELGTTPRLAAIEANDTVSFAPVNYRRGYDIINTAEDTVPHLLEPIMPEASITLLAGHSGTYKTWAALSLMLDGAFGYTWNEHPAIKKPVEPFTSIYLNKEMGGQMLGVRLRQLALALKYNDRPDFEEILNDRVIVVEEKEMNLIHEHQRARLEDLVIATGAKLIFLDSFSMCWTGDENSASEVADFFMQMRGISERTSVGWNIIHHLVKPQGTGQRRIAPDKFTVRGSGQIVQQADSALLFSAFDTNQPLLDGQRLIAIHHAKTRTSLELPAWLTSFNLNDGLFISLAYGGLVSEAKAREYTKSGGDPTKLMEWTIASLGTMPVMMPSATGLRTKALISLLGASWPTSEGKQPSESTIRRQIDQLAEAGFLEILDTNKGIGNLYRLKEEPLLTSEPE